MKLTYYGHSCFSVVVDGAHLLFDPFITANPKAAEINVDEIPADYILVSHGHYDHVDDVERIAKRTGATLVSNFEVVQWFARRGVEKAHAMNIGGAWNFPFGRVKMTSATHSSSMPDGSYGGSPAGFLVETKRGHFYYSGDTALTRNLGLIGDSASLKFAILCIGDNFTMGPEDAARAANFLEVKDVVGVHYDTFPPIEIDRKEAVREFAERGLNLHLLPIGGSREF